MDKRPRDQAIDEAYRTMVSYAKPLGEFADCHMVASRKSVDRQQCLVLLSRKAGIVCRRFAERRELAQQIAELGQNLVVGFRQLSRAPQRAYSGHAICPLISQCDILFILLPSTATDDQHTFDCCP